MPVRFARHDALRHRAGVRGFRAVAREATGESADQLTVPFGRLNFKARHAALDLTRSIVSDGPLLRRAIHRNPSVRPGYISGTGFEATKRQPQATRIQTPPRLAASRCDAGRPWSSRRPPCGSGRSRGPSRGPSRGASCLSPRAWRRPRPPASKLRAERGSASEAPNRRTPAWTATLLRLSSRLRSQRPFAWSLTAPCCDSGEPSRPLSLPGDV